MLFMDKYFCSSAHTSMTLRTLGPDMFIIKEHLVCVESSFNRDADNSGPLCECMCLFCSKVCQGTLGAKDKIYSSFLLADSYPLVATPCAFVNPFLLFLPQFHLLFMITTIKKHLTF